MKASSVIACMIVVMLVIGLVATSRDGRLALIFIGVGFAFLYGFVRYNETED